MFTSPLYLLTCLCLLVVVSEWLVRRTWLRHLGTALLVILFTAIVANLGLMPAGSTAERPVPTYDAIFTYIAPLSIFWLLLQVNLQKVWQAGLPIVSLFLIGSLGTTFGVVFSMWMIGGATLLGEIYAAVGGMFVGTYTGGSVNFNAVALHYDVVRNGTIYGGSVVVDNIMTTVWMITTIALPKLLGRYWPNRAKVNLEQTVESGPLLGIEEDTERLHPIELGLILALGMAALLLSNWLADWTATLGWSIPSIIFITILALIIAQLPIQDRLKGGQLLGMFSVYIFLAVIGAFCDLSALKGLGALGPTLLLFVVIAVALHGLIIFGAAWLLKIDPAMAAVASQANVGGGTSALALARSLGRNDLVLPAVLLGALGNALGTFLGFWAAGYLLPWIMG